MRPIIREVNAKTNKIVERELNDKEFAVYENEIAKTEKAAQESLQKQQQIQAAKNSAKEKLAALGLSEAEVTALLGA